MYDGKVRTANLPRFALQPKEAAFLMTVVAIVGYGVGLFMGLFF